MIGEILIQNRIPEKIMFISIKINKKTNLMFYLDSKKTTIQNWSIPKCVGERFLNGKKKSDWREEE